MLHAVSYALADSINALLIGILVAVGIMLPRGRYRTIAALVLIGDWLGVLAAAAAVIFFLLGIKEKIADLLSSPVAGIVLIIVAIGLGIGAWRSGGQPSELLNRLLGPLRTPSARTVLIGFIMGAIQSLTSVPFYYGLMYLAAGDYSRSTQYLGLVWYATLALGLPTLIGLLIALVRAHPHSAAGKIFARARSHSTALSLFGSYAVAAFLLIMGLLSL